MKDSTYRSLLVTVAYPSNDDIRRYCVGVSANDSRLQSLIPSAEEWYNPKARKRMLSLLCEDWLTDDCHIMGYERIDGAVQWGAVPEGTGHHGD